MHKSRRVEFFHLQRFLDTAGIVPSGPIVHTDSPDFLVPIAHHTIGIEHTEFFFHSGDGPPQQMLDALSNLLIEHARREFRQAGGPPLYVWAHVHREPRTKREALELGSRFSQIVLANGWSSTLEEGEKSFDLWRDLPAIARYTILPSVDGKDELWTCGGGGWVATVEPQHIAGVLNAKAHRHGRYRAKAADVWLLIVNDMFRGGTPCEIGMAARTAVYEHPFARAYWFDQARTDLVQLAKGPPTLRGS